MYCRFSGERWSHSIVPSVLKRVPCWYGQNGGSAKAPKYEFSLEYATGQSHCIVAALSVNMCVQIELIMFSSVDLNQHTSAEPRRSLTESLVKPGSCLPLWISMIVKIFRHSSARLVLHHIHHVSPTSRIVQPAYGGAIVLDILWRLPVLSPRSSNLSHLSQSAVHFPRFEMGGARRVVRCPVFKKYSHASTRLT